MTGMDEFHLDLGTLVASDSGTNHWKPPASTAAQLSAGRALRGSHPRSMLSQLTVPEDRDPLGVIDEQNATRVPELLALRAERMSHSPFAFYRGTAAIMAADLSGEPHTGITIASCGDAHIANFGFYASPQRTLVFDLNDFDEAGWAPWEWDLKRLVTSVVIAGADTARDEAVVLTAARDAVRIYARTLRAAMSLMSPTERYYAHIDAEAGAAYLPEASQKVLRRAIKHAQRHTGDQAVAKLTVTDGDGRVRFVTDPPTTARLDPALRHQVGHLLNRYMSSVSPDIHQLLRHYALADGVRRAVGVGSVGTRCSLVAFADGDGRALILQSKQAETTVLEHYGKVAQPRVVRDLVERDGHGARVIALQRILQSVSDPFLGSLRADGIDFYVRQFHDMKGGIEATELDDEPFIDYAKACGVALARAHAQSPHAALISGYIGGGRRLSEALCEWSFAYAALSREDHQAYLCRNSL